MSRVAALVLLLAAEVAAAQEPRDEDRLDARMAEAAQALQAGDYAAALTAFREARTISDRPVLLFNIAMCHRELDDWDAAVTAFDEYLAAGRETEPEDRLAEAARQRSEMTSQLGELEPRLAVDGAELAVDGHIVGTTPLVRPVRLREGTHVVTARRPGFAEGRVEVTIVPGARTAAELVLLPLEPLEPSPAELLEPWFWGLAGTTGALGLATAALGTAMILYRDDYLLGDRRDAGLYDRTLELALATDVLLGVTLAAAVAAGLLAWFAWAPPDDDERPADEPAVGFVPGGLVLTW
ncbi:MAG: tetratricopeptide repeat protein [Deltaproteobacteria bacterium]|nr:tetratricopeptide repeat protein [Deltaproteobacteria bacterium]